ncbi:hypothetical protein MLD52_12910 [Puniceicoccaceae bacterium K14]|nr:hypothetical protein [Puniceicoccaceae bacterium K14]
MIIEVENFSAAEMIDGSTLSNGDIVLVNGHTNRMDGGEGSFQWVAGNTDVEDSGTVIKLNDGTSGSLKREYSGKLSVAFFGASGDGSECTSAIQAALDCCSNQSISSLFIPAGDYIVNTTLTVTSDRLAIQNEGTLIFDDGFDANYGVNTAVSSYFSFSGGKLVDNADLNSRNALHRALRAEGCDFFVVENVSLDGWYTNIHANLCETFVFNNIQMSRTLGVDAQYGYGINSSAKRNFGSQLYWDNSSHASHGRHMLYLNGTASFASIIGLYGKGCVRNPVNISLDTANEGSISLRDLFVEDVLTDPGSTTGVVNISSGNNPPPDGVEVLIDGLCVDGYDGRVVSMPSGGYKHSKLLNITAKNHLGDGTRPFDGIQAEGVDSVTIRNVFIDKLASSSSKGVELEEGSKALVERIIVPFNQGQSVVRLDDQEDSVVRDITSGITEKVSFNDADTCLYERPIKEGFVQLSGSSPDVENLKKVFFSEGSSLLVQNFLNGFDGQELYVTSMQGNVTIEDNSDIYTIGHINIAMSSNQTILLVKRGSRWIQVS